jgi:hypothetical protein
LEQEIKDVEEAEAPPAVLARLQAQVRVEAEEIRLLEEQLQALTERGPRRALQKKSGLGSGGGPSMLVRVVLAILATGVLLAVAALVLPHRPASTTEQAVPPTHTLFPTYTPGIAAYTPTVQPGPIDTPTPSGPTATPTPQPPTLTPTPAELIGIVNVDVLNLRGGPATTFGIKAKLSSGDRLVVSGRNDAEDWLAVTTLDGATGWVAAEYVTLPVDVKSLPVKEAAE